MRDHKILSGPFYLALLVAISIALSGCGIKPDHVDPPPGAENNDYPRTYPAPESDLPTGGPPPF